MNQDGARTPELILPPSSFILFSTAPRPGFEPGTPRSKRGMIVRFTIGASSGRQGSRTLISGLENRLSRAARPTVSGYLPEWTARELHPHFQRAKPASSSWTSSPMSDPGWTRTIVAWMWARSRRRWTTGPIVSSRGGSRTHNRSPGSRPGRFADLRTRPSRKKGDRPHLPERPGGCFAQMGSVPFFPTSCGGRIRTGVERLMRPCWDPGSSPLRSDQGESRTPTPKGHDVLSVACLPVAPLGQSQ